MRATALVVLHYVLVKDGLTGAGKPALGKSGCRREGTRDLACTAGIPAREPGGKVKLSLLWHGLELDPCPTIRVGPSNLAHALDGPAEGKLKFELNDGARRLRQRRPDRHAALAQV